LSLSKSLEEVGHLNDVLGSIREISSLLSRDQNRQDLLDGVCQCLMHTRGYVTVWVGEPDEVSGEVKIVAHSGLGASIRLHAPIRWDESALGQGPTGTALRDRRPVVFDNLANDPRFAPWLDPVLATGAVSIASVPLIHLGRLFGVLTVKADKLNAFDAEEVALLKRLAEDVGRVLQAMEDQRERELAHAALRENEQRIALAASGTRIGMFEWNIASGETFWNEQHAQLLGVSTTTRVFTPYQYVNWAERVHPEDLCRIENELHRCKSERVPYEAEYRVVWPDGSVHWVAARGLFQHDKQGRPSLMRGIVMDITERKRLENALQESNERLWALVSSSPVAIISMDPEGIVTQWNPAAVRMFGWLEDEVLGRFLPIVAEGNLMEHRALRERVLRGEGFADAEVRRFRKDGSPIDISISTAPLRNPYGEVTGIMIVSIDITERKRVGGELREYRLELEKRVKNVPRSYPPRMLCW
jgi:PAS domain S-box-containing protein